MSNLTHVIYASKAAIEFSKHDIIKFLSLIRKNNASLNVTGMLLYDDGTFFQVIEGEDSVVKSLFSEIKADVRHEQVVSIISEPIRTRQFNDWDMGFADISSHEIKKTEGLNDFFQGGKCLSKVAPGRAKKLLKAFSQGRWRIS